jgi:putative transposase
MGGFIIARLKRIWSPEHFHHITKRGNWRGDLYRDEKDFRAFLFILMDVCKDYQVEIISYCLMSNHYHLLLRTQTTSISIIMARINKHYADYYNNRHQVSGHLYEKPFYSKPVYDSFGLLENIKFCAIP